MSMTILCKYNIIPVAKIDLLLFAKFYGWFHNAIKH